jgi:hypothetical protein
MDVHHHSHTADPDNHRGRKKWTHYFWEFLMLFLAVFCGFLAEYQLEHKIESDRGKQYVLSMYEDLKMDTLAMSTIIHNRTRRNEMFDSIFSLIDNPGIHLNDLYFFARHLTRTAPILFFNNDRTIQQLKYSGGLRLITNKRISDSIMIYDKQVRLVLDRQETELANIRESLPYYYRIFDSRVLVAMQDTNNNINRPVSSLALLKFSQEDLNVFLGYCQGIKAINLGNIVHLKVLREKAVELIRILKKENNLK